MINQKLSYKKLEMRLINSEGVELCIYSFENGTLNYCSKNRIRITEEQFKEELEQAGRINSRDDLKYITKYTKQ